MFQDAKKPIQTILKRQDTGGDDADQEDGWNRTGGSNATYVPSFGGTGTLSNTFNSMCLSNIFDQRVKK